MRPLSRARALWTISLVTLVITGGSLLALKLAGRWQEVRKSESHYIVREILQTGPSFEALPTEYLAELLDLSTDRPTNLYALDLSEAESTLRSSPWIRDAQVKRIKPGTLYIDYTVREPIAALPDEPNWGLDIEGERVPLAPFYQDCGLPKIYLDESPYHALNLLHLLSHRVSITQIDLRPRSHPSAARREIRINLGIRELRLPPDDYEQALSNYFVLEPHLPPHPVTIDLRLPHLGYLQ